jgi:translation initiation factor 4G
MRDAIARKMEADKAEEQRKKLEEESKASKDSKDAEEKVLKEKEEADKQEREAAHAKEMAEEALKKDKAEAEEAEKAAAKVKEEVDEAAEKARKEQEQEDEIARMEAEYAEIERKEKEAEERYQQKKKADREEAARKEAEALKMEDEEMKRAEREAEEAEEARLRELEKAEGDNSQKERDDMFAALKKDGSATPASDTLGADEPQVDSGVATPASDAPAAPSQSSSSVGKKRPADLKLDTTKPVEAAQPTPQLDSLRSARMIQRIEDISYPADIASPNPALNRTAPMGKFRYGKDFLLQFETKFTEKPSINWDARLKETVGDTTEPSSARTPARGSAGGSSMMGGRQASHRGPPSQPVMGSFAQGGRTLPPGTSSQQRFEAATAGRSAAPSRQTMTNPLANFVPNRTGGFPQPGGMSVKMDRTPSTTSLNHPNSPRNASQRGGSQRGSRAATQREKPGDNNKMPLTAGANLKPIEVTAGGWKPRSVGQNATGMAGPAPGGNGHMDPEQVQRKVKSNLNKMAPEKFEKITEQILDISAQSKDESDGRTLRQVIQLTFEKATDESHWAEMYAQFCKRMLESMSPEIKDENIIDKKGEVVHGGALFRKYLLNRCQEEFEAGWKVNLGDKPEGESEEAVMLSEAYYREATAKRRGLGLVKFIGELYKLGMLTERIMHECVKKLVDYEGIPDESEVESLTSLLKTIGRPLDSTEKGNKMVDAYFTKINEMIVIEGLPSRLRFMLMVSTIS